MRARNTARTATRKEQRMHDTKRPTMRAAAIRTDASATIRLDHAEPVTDSDGEPFVPLVLHVSVERDHTGGTHARMLAAANGLPPRTASWSTGPGRRLVDAPLPLRAAAIAHLPAIEPYMSAVPS